MLLVHSKKSNSHQKIKVDLDESVTNVMFSMSENQRLHLDVHLLNRQTLNYLQHQISRNRFDLRSHVQRILLSVSLYDSEAVFGAMLDLFITLDEKGYELRHRMLSVSRPQLSLAHRVFLAKSLQSGLTASDVMPLSSCSTLSLGYTGVQQMVSVNVPQYLKEIDPVSLANDYIEYGQIDAARDLLESAMLEQPWRKDLHTDLLSLYRATRDQKRSEKMYEKLANTAIPDHIVWKDTLHYIRQASGDS